MGLWESNDFFLHFFEKMERKKKGKKDETKQLNPAPKMVKVQ